MDINEIRTQTRIAKTQNRRESHYQTMLGYYWYMTLDASPIPCNTVWELHDRLTSLQFEPRGEDAPDAAVGQAHNAQARRVFAGLCEKTGV